MVGTVSDTSGRPLREAHALRTTNGDVLALQRLREAGVVALEDGGAYRVRDPDVVRTSRAEELDQVVAADLRRLYDRGFSVEEIRESYQRKLPSSFLQREPH